MHIHMCVVHTEHTLIRSTSTWTRIDQVISCIVINVCTVLDWHLCQDNITFKARRLIYVLYVYVCSDISNISRLSNLSKCMYVQRGL